MQRSGVSGHHELSLGQERRQFQQRSRHGQRFGVIRDPQNFERQLLLTGTGIYYAANFAPLPELGAERAITFWWPTLRDPAAARTEQNVIGDLFEGKFCG